MTELTLGNAKISTQASIPLRISMLLWGVSGCGKTSLAMTAPGKKLHIAFDPDAAASLGGMPNDSLIVADFSGMSPSDIEKIQGDNPLKLREFITDNEIDTIIVDSMTTLGDICTERGAERAAALSANAKIRPSAIFPTMQGYQFRNGLLLQTTRSLLRLSSVMKKHIIFIAHEDQPERNADGIVMHINMMLGGKLQAQVPLNLSEIWNLRDDGKKNRWIAIRPCRQRQPMKTRMFSTTEEPEFQWKFDPDNWKGDTIEGWYHQWVENGGKKIPLPK